MHEFQILAVAGGNVSRDHCEVGHVNDMASGHIDGHVTGDKNFAPNILLSDISDIGTPGRNTKVKPLLHEKKCSLCPTFCKTKEPLLDTMWLLGKRDSLSEQGVMQDTLVGRGGGGGEILS